MYGHVNVKLAITIFSFVQYIPAHDQKKRPKRVGSLSQMCI
jgi:hypothetical protein